MLSEDFEGPTNGSELFPNGVTGAQKTVNLRVIPFLGKCFSVLVGQLRVSSNSSCNPVPSRFLVLHSL